MAVDRHRTGSIWSKPARVRGQVIRRVCESLERVYGKPRLGNPEDPVDDLIFIIVSNKTGPDTARKIYQSLKKEFKTWDDALNSPSSVIQAIIYTAGFANLRTQHIQTALQKIKSDFGIYNLNRLKEKPEKEVENYLRSLPGASEKVAKCVMMYTLDMEVLPVDSHVHRIAKRLGWTARKRLDQCHEELELLVPPYRRYAFHVDAILHGRSTCRPKTPKCKDCCINTHCESFVP
ncbi:MAG: hypothetical protein GY801_20265 [bacterium]|nr:hypothetical protein [bacterium]